MAEANNSKDVRAILELPEFKALVSKQWRVSLTLTISMLVIYFGFIMLVAWRKDLLAIKLGEHLTLGLPLGLGLILATCLLTGIYVQWANNSHDAAVQELKKRVLEQLP